MSIFKTTLSVESTDQSAPVKFTTAYNNNLLDNIVMGKVTVDTNPTEISLSGEKSRGSFLYVKSSEKNPKQNIVGIASSGGVITLSPGEFAVIPLYTFDDNNSPGGPFGANSLAAFTTHGTAELEYFTGSRGEEVGESVLVRFKEGSTWKYFTLDANTAIPGGGLNIFMNSSIIDTNIDTTMYPRSTMESIVNQKGYIIRFFSDSSSYHKFVFVNSRGSIIDTEDFNNQSWYRYNGDGRANLITWYDGDDGHAIYFDGDNYWQHDFSDISDIYVDDNWDACTADGTFPVYIEEINGTSNEALFLIKGADKTLIKTTDALNDIYSNAYVYSHGNFIAVETINEDPNPNELETLEIFSTDGTLLKRVDFNSMPLDYTDYYFYGTGKLQIVCREAVTGVYTFLNYNQLTGKLNGEDLTWTSTLDEYEVVSDNYYTGGGQDYKPESVAIIKYYDEDRNDENLLNQSTDGDLEVTYIINNDLEWRNYVVPSTEDSYFASNDYYTNNYATDKDFVLLSGDNQTNGPLVATRFTSGAEPTRFNLINNLSLYDVGDYDAYVECFGDYRVLQVPTKISNNPIELIVYDSKVLDKVLLSNNDWDWEFNTLIGVDYDANKEWYFNTSTKKWTLLPTYTDGYWWTTVNEGPQYPVSTGKITFIRDQYNPTSHSIQGRMITRGVAGNEKELLKVGNTPGFEMYTWSFNISTETAVLAYKETQNSNYKVRVFDLNLNFLYEVDTEKTSRGTRDTYGKLNYWEFYDSEFNYTHYKFGKLMSSLSLERPFDGFTRDFNTAAWF